MSTATQTAWKAYHVLGEALRKLARKGAPESPEPRRKRRPGRPARSAIAKIGRGRPPKLITVGQAARLAKTSPATILKLVAHGHVGADDSGGTLRIGLTSLRKHLKANGGAA